MREDETFKGRIQVDWISKPLPAATVGLPLTERICNIYFLDIGQPRWLEQSLKNCLYGGFSVVLQQLVRSVQSSQANPHMPRFIEWHSLQYRI